MNKQTELISQEAERIKKRNADLISAITVVKQNKQIGDSIKNTQHHKPNQLKVELEHQGASEKALKDETVAWEKQIKLMEE